MASKERKRSPRPSTRREPGRGKDGPKSGSSGADRKQRKEKVSVLLLTFAYHDLGAELDDQVREVRAAFDNLGYAVKARRINMQNSRESLVRRIESLTKHFDQTDSHGDSDSDSHEGEDEVDNKESHVDDLWIIYYAGHGGMIKPGEFGIASHNYPSSDVLIPRLWDKINQMFDSTPTRERTREIFKELQPIAIIPWKGIYEAIMKIKCDTLVILDCCDAGLASAMGRYSNDEASRNTYRKELLAACTWGNETGDRMSPALCDALRSIGSGDANGLSTLVRKMNNTLSNNNVENAEKTDELYSVPQAAHYVLGKTEAPRIILKNLKPLPTNTEPKAEPITTESSP